MSPEERQLLQGLFDRMRSQANGQRDAEAERFIADNVRNQPYAPYLLSQTVIVQDQALQAANQKLQDYEQQIQELQRNAPQQGSGGGGFLSGLFGGGASQAQPAPQQRPSWNQGGTQQAPQYAPPQQQGGPWGGGAPQGQWGGAPQQSQWGGGQQAPAAGGGGFLKGALGAAAGVAGGVLLADSIRGLMGGHNSPFGIGSGMGGFGGMGGGETVVNNYYENDGAGGGSDWQRDAAQDASAGGGVDSADWQQDADQDQDAAQDDSYDV